MRASAHGSHRVKSRYGFGVVLAAAAIAVGMGCRQPSAPAHPNVVLVVVDTLRADHLGSYGYARAATPRLDAFAASGVRFTGARAASSWTLPSVASILTGRYAVEHGVERLESALNDEQVTVAETFTAAGYETAAFSANISLVIPESGFAQGFARFDVIEDTLDPNRAADPVLVRDGTNRSAQAAPANRVTDAVLGWFRARTQPERPYFLYVHYFDPHASYTPPPDYAERFGVKADDPLLARGQAIVTFGAKPPPPDQLATLVALYDAEIAFTDHEIGRLLDGLGVPGDHARDTVVVLTADHGEEFGEHGGMLHGRTLFEEMLHVPLVVAGAGVPTNRIVEAPVSLVSIAATLADLAAVPPSPTFGGHSLAPAIHGAAAVSEVVFAELAPSLAIHRSAAIEGTWKLLLGKGFVPSVYDLATDPGERTDRRQNAGGQTAALQKAIGEHNKAGFKVRASAPPEKRTLDAERRERLRQLGYVE